MKFNVVVSSKRNHNTLTEYVHMSVSAIDFDEALFYGLEEFKEKNPTYVDVKVVEISPIL